MQVSLCKHLRCDSWSRLRSLQVHACSCNRVHVQHGLLLSSVCFGIFQKPGHQGYLPAQKIENENGTPVGVSGDAQKHPPG